MPAAGPRLAVVGAGAWGTTLAVLLSAREPVSLVVRDASHARRLRADGENRRYLPGVALPEQIVVASDASVLESATELIVLAVPSVAMRSTVRAIAGAVPDDAVLLSVAKGIEREFAAADDPGRGRGGTRRPIARGGAVRPQPGAGDLARAACGCRGGAAEDDVSRRVAEIVGSRTFRLYRNRDVVGVELAGALKNIVAIVAGAVDALGAGDNAKAAITTRGLAEITRLGVAMGANPLTFAGLAGIGDILATSSSALSRNHRLGVELASGRAWTEIEGTLPGVAEGAYTVRAALALAERHGVELPIAQEVHAVLYEGKDVRSSVTDLLARESKDELSGLPTT